MRCGSPVGSVLAPTEAAAETQTQSGEPSGNDRPLTRPSSKTTTASRRYRFCRSGLKTCRRHVFFTSRSSGFEAPMKAYNEREKAKWLSPVLGEPSGIRTPDTLIKSQNALSNGFHGNSFFYFWEIYITLLNLRLQVKLLSWVRKGLKRRRPWQINF